MPLTCKQERGEASPVSESPCLRVTRNRLSCILPSNTLGLASPPHWCPSESPAKALLSRITEIKSHGYVTKVNGKGKKNEQRTLSEKTGGTACLVPVRKSRFLREMAHENRSGMGMSFLYRGQVMFPE